MKKILFTALTATTLILSSLLFVKADGLDLKVSIDNKLVNFTNGKPFVNNNRTMVPLRDISQQMGYTVSWVPSTNSVELAKGNDKIDVKIGNISITVNGVSQQMDVPTLAIQGVTYVPVKFIGEAFGYNIAYDGNTQTVKVTSGSTNQTNPTPQPSQPSNPPSIDLKVTIDNKQVSFSNGKPFVNNNRTMVPLRDISEQTGYTVSWVSSTNSVEITKGTNKIDLKIGDTNILVNGVTQQMDAESLAVNGTTYVPVKFVGDALGYDVTYDGNTQTVQLKTKIPSPTPIPTPPPMTPTTPVVNTKVYNLELSKWNIYNDGTHPVETTAGLNNALQWAHNNGYTTLSVPAGTYLISKGTGAWNDTTSYITLPSDMTLLSDANTIYQKETNGFHGYKTIVIPMFAQNDIIKGGTFKGDKDTHDYYDGAVKWQANKVYKTGDKVISTTTVADSSGYYYMATNDGTSGSKEPSWSNSKNTTDNTVIWKPVARDTNEGGYGIITDGAYNVTIDGIKAINYTGDGMAIGGNRGYQSGGGQNSFESGTIDDNGNKVADATKVRTIGYFPLTDPSFDKTHTFVVDMVRGFSQNYDAYFYKADGTYLSKAVNQQRGYFVAIPTGATKVALVFTGTLNSGINLEFQNKVQSTNIVVENSEFAFNRRQGITVGGGNNVLIYNNQIHDMKGTMPQSGIDVEGGFWEDGTLNTNINIENNTLYNNAKYDIVLYDGNTALVQGNHIHAFSDHGAVGLSIPSPFTNATVKDNDFYDTSIYAYHDVHFIGNTFQYSYTYLEGPNISIDGMQFISARFFMYPTKPYGITVNNISMTNGAVLGIWNNPVVLNNVTASDFAWDYTDTNVPAGTIINNLKMTGNLYGGFGAATYNNCSFQVSGWGNQALSISNGGTYTFNNCTFGGPKFTGFKVSSPDADVSINNSSIDVALDSPAVLVEKAKSIDIENTNIASKATAGTQKAVVMIGDDWTNSNASPILKATLKGNTITSVGSTNTVTSVFSGQNAPSYDIENNTLYNGTLNLKTNDINLNNIKK